MKNCKLNQIIYLIFDAMNVGRRVSSEHRVVSSACSTAHTKIPTRYALARIIIVDALMKNETDNFISMPNDEAIVFWLEKLRRK